MKTLFQLALISFIGFTILSGCSKKDDDNSTPDNNSTPTGNSMNCKVDGNAWSASLAVVATNTGGVLTVTGSDSNGKQCQVIIFSPSGTGSYELGNTMTNQSNGRWTGSPDPMDTYSTMLGQGAETVEITELTATNVKGTFSFTAKNSASTEVSITEGSFSSTFSSK